MNEAEWLTRKKRIDTRLRALNPPWQIILDGYLVDYEPVAIKSQVRMNGVFLKEGETVERGDTDTGQKALDQLEDERAYDAAEVERSITAPDSNRKIIEEVAQYAYEHEAQTGRFPKILIFAVNDLPHTSHADQLVRLCREVFKQGDSFVQKITGNPNVDRPLQRIREFRNRPNPIYRTWLRNSTPWWRISRP